MIAELICVGTELLMGQVLNTNAHFIAKELAPSGIDMFHQIVVGDNSKRLTEAIDTVGTLCVSEFSQSPVDGKRTKNGESCIPFVVHLFLCEEHQTKTIVVVILELSLP